MALNTTEADSGVRAGWSGWRINRLLPETEHQFLLSSTWLLVTSVAMILCYALNIANPGIILMVAVVHSGLTGGWRAGLASAGLATVFTAIYLSEPHRLLSYTPSDAWQLFAMAATSLGTVLLIRRWRRRDHDMVKRLASQLRETRESVDSEKAFQSLANDAPVLLWISDEEGKRMYFNRSWISFTGASQAEQMGERWMARIHPDDRAGLEHRYAHAVRQGQSFEAEYRIRSASGEYRWLHDTGVPHLNDEGRLVGYLGCAADRTERKETETALHQLSGRLLELQDDERRRIARELHDTTAQNLAALSMHLFTLHEAVKKGDRRAQWAAEESLSLAEQCTQEIRTLSYLLHPPLLDELGLVSALRSYANGFMQRTAVRVDLKIEEIGRMSPDLETTIFRIVQEALTNVHRHSGSAAAEVRVIRDPKEVKVIVTDEGSGIPPEKLRLLGQGASLGVGVAGMGERASQLGGNLKIASSEQGTTITVVLPCGGTE